MPRGYWTKRKWDWFPRQPTVAEKRARAAEAASRLARGAKRGDGPEPVVLAGHKIAATLWGKAWCRNLESYSDFSNRLPRGRSYLRSGAVIDLKIAPGKVRARVAGSRLYDVEISIRALPPESWQAVVGTCGGRIDSMVALLEGRIPDEVMHVVTDPEQGLFPKPRQIAMTCSCPDWADVCKHVAAVFYGVGARLDQRPELLFTLRGVDPADLVHAAAGEVATAGDGAAPGDLAEADLGQLFGIELAAPTETPRSKPRKARSAAKPKKKTPQRPARPRRASASPIAEFAARLAAAFAPAPRTSRRRPKAK